MVVFMIARGGVRYVQTKGEGIMYIMTKHALLKRIRKACRLGTKHPLSVHAQHHYISRLAQHCKNTNARKCLWSTDAYVTLCLCLHSLEKNIALDWVVDELKALRNKKIA